MTRTEPSADDLAGHPATGEALADLGEWELIRRLGAFARPGQFADDAALLEEPAGPSGPTADGAPSEAGRSLVINTDVLVDGIHFSDATTAAADVGWRAAAANLSDLAAMGATEVVGLTVGLVAPGHTPWSWVEGVYQGIAACLRAHGGELLGGDCSGGSQRLLAITALGRLAGGRSGPIRRGDGRPGDLLVCTGPHGLSRLGLALLQGELAGTEAQPPSDRGKTWSHPPCARKDVAEAQALASQTPLTPALIQRAIRAHRRPVPRFDAVVDLIRSRPAATAWRVAGCDSSDGLGAAVTAIAAASGCEARLERARLPLDPAMAALPQAQAWCLNGGEDFELVLALDPSWAKTFVAASPGSDLIGTLVEGAAGSLVWSDAAGWPGETEATATGYQHFR